MSRHWDVLQQLRASRSGREFVFVARALEGRVRVRLRRRVWSGGGYELWSAGVGGGARRSRLVLRGKEPKAPTIVFLCKWSIAQTLINRFADCSTPFSVERELHALLASSLLQPALRPRLLLFRRAPPRNTARLAVFGMQRLPRLARPPPMPESD